VGASIRAPAGSGEGQDVFNLTGLTLPAGGQGNTGAPLSLLVRTTGMLGAFVYRRGHALSNAKRWLEWQGVYASVPASAAAVAGRERRPTHASQRHPDEQLGAGAGAMRHRRCQCRNAGPA
jgi:hypothetical protein